MEPQKITSIGDWEFTVGKDDDNALLIWEDDVSSGDALFTPEDAVALGLALIATGSGAEVRPETLKSIARHLESGATTMMRPESQTYAEWHLVAALLRRLAPEGETP